MWLDKLKKIKKQNLLFMGISIGVVLIMLFAPKNKDLVKQNTSLITSTPTPSYGEIPPLPIIEEEKVPEYLLKYRLMFLHLPKTKKAGEITTLGWNNDLPIYSDGSNTYELKTGAQVNNLETPTDSLTLEDNQKVLIQNYSNGAKTTIYKSQTPINPASISTNGDQIAFTNETSLLIYSPKVGVKSYKLDDSTIKSTTFFLKDGLFLVEKVEIPRLLDFVMLVDQVDGSFKQIVTSSSIINRLNLDIKPAVNSKQDMVLFAENQGLVWLLNRDKAIERVFPDLNLPDFSPNSAP